MKEFFKSWFNAQRSSMLWGILIIIVGIILAIIICGIYGNNDQNFYYHPKAESIAQADTTAKKPIVTIHPRKPFVARGVNVVNGKVVKG